MRLKVYRYRNQPADFVPVWAVGRGTAQRTVWMLWTPWAFVLLTTPKVGKRGSTIHIWKERTA